MKALNDYDEKDIANALNKMICLRVVNAFFISIVQGYDNALVEFTKCTRETKQLCRKK